MKKNLIKKIAVSILSVSILLSFAGCGNSSKISENSSSTSSSSTVLEEISPKEFIENDANERFSEIDGIKEIVVKENDSSIENIADYGYIVAINADIGNGNTATTFYGANINGESVSYKYGGTIAEIDGEKYYQLKDNGSWYDEDGNEMNFDI